MHEQQSSQNAASALRLPTQHKKRKPKSNKMVKTQLMKNNVEISDHISFIFLLHKNRLSLIVYFL
jgi:hypothetical protein